jgi:ATP-citrate lyase beta-subunit
MAQVWIREFDAKKMYFDFIWKSYNAYKISELSELENIDKNRQYVVKPDMLFWKRWKYGLVWVDLDKTETVSWMYEKYNKQMNISGITGNLNVFLIEDFIPHSKEYYISFSAERDCDMVNFSFEGWVEVEENWESITSLHVWLNQELQEINLEKIGITDPKIKETILSLWKYYKTYWFVYLEVNPFCFHEKTWELVLLDMVAKVDDQEFFKQKENWHNLEIPNTFGFKENEREKYISKLDQETWASLKFKVLNPQAKIWTLLSWGGWSLVITDSIWKLWFADEIWNYWELSGNPNRDFTKAYTRALLDQVLENKIKWKYLIIWWAITNFSDIAVSFAWIIDILEEKQNEILEQEIQILVRRWGINEAKGLELIKTACTRLQIPCQVADSTEYMTDILKEIKL